MLYSSKILNEKPLRFSRDGTFKILHLTDIHNVIPEMDKEIMPIECSRDMTKETINVENELIGRTNPDLIVFGGDNISGYREEYTEEYMKKAIDEILEPVRKKGIPLAIVFGNHDSELVNIKPYLERKNQIKIYSGLYSNFVSTENDEKMSGCANNSFPILASGSDDIKFNVYCVDSNDYPRDKKTKKRIPHTGYDNVHEDQIKWYEKRSDELKNMNGGKVVPSILFQHIPVRQEYDLVEESDENNFDMEDGGKFFKIRKDLMEEGEMFEFPSPPEKESGQFDSWVEKGDLKAAFFGHDHVNSFLYTKDGIKLYQTISAGYHSYGNDKHGGRLITINEDSSFTTETLTVKRITEEKFPW
jgi:hypothetical protein